MPFPRTWLPQFPRIAKDVQDFPTAEMDRDAVMSIFGLKRRAALLLMREVGPIRTRGRWVLTKTALAGWLMDQAEDASREIERKARWSRTMLRADVERPRQRTPLLSARLTPEEVAKINEFPGGVELIPGEPHRLVVEFTSMEALGESLLAVGIAINKNLDKYMALLETPAERAQREAEEADAAYFREILASAR